MKNKFIHKDTEIHWEIMLKPNSEIKLVLLHGFMADSSVWDSIIHELPYSVITIDLPGFGKSNQVNYEFYSLSFIAEIIHKLAIKENWNSIHVIGHSMGGYVLLEWLKLDPTYISSCALLHSTPLADSEEKKQNRTKTIVILYEKPQLFIQEFYTNLFATSNTDKLQGRINELKKQSKEISIPHIIATQVALRDRNDNLEIWKNSPIPKAIFLGKYDKLISYEEMNLIHQAIPIPIFTFENSGHMSFYEEPQELISIIKEWISHEG